jgi:predicted nucleotidyltransferase
MNLQNLPINKLKQIRDYFSKKAEVKTVFLFGSYARGKATEQSDIDLAVIFKNNVEKSLFNNLGGFMEDLSSILNAKVDVQDLDQAGAMFKFFDYQTRAVDEYFDLKPVYNEILSEMSKRIKNNSFGCCPLWT